MLKSREWAPVWPLCSSPPSVFCNILHRAANDGITNDDLLCFLINTMTGLTVLGVVKRLFLLLETLK